MPGNVHHVDRFIAGTGSDAKCPGAHGPESISHPSDSASQDTNGMAINRRARAPASVQQVAVHPEAMGVVDTSVLSSGCGTRR